MHVSTSQVLDMFGSLLERPLIAADAQKRYPVLVKMFDKELDRCNELYKKHTQAEEHQGEMKAKQFISRARLHMMLNIELLVKASMHPVFRTHL